MSRIYPLFAAVIIGMSLLLAGCDSRPALDKPVSAETSEALNYWVGRSGLSAVEQQDFEKAVSELKILVMNEKGSSRSAVMEEGMLAKVNGKSAREVLVSGFEARKRRLDRERLEVEERLANDSRLKTRPDDKESANYLAHVVKTHQDRIATLKEEIAAIDAKLHSWSAPGR